MSRIYANWLGAALAGAMLCSATAARADDLDGPLAALPKEIVTESTGFLVKPAAYVSATAIGCRALGLRGCAVGFVLATVFSNTVWAKVADQGNRLANVSGFATTFTGTASDGEGTVRYSGSRLGSIVNGSYTGPEGSGQFGGTINRAGTVSGNYIEGSERGIFSGIATRSLDRVLGNTICTINCE